MPRACSMKPGGAVAHISAAAINNFSGTPVIAAVCGRVHCAAIFVNLIEADRVGVDERAIDPAALDHDPQHAGEERRIAARLHRQDTDRRFAPQA